MIHAIKIELALGRAGQLLPPNAVVRFAKLRADCDSAMARIIRQRGGEPLAAQGKLAEIEEAHLERGLPRRLVTLRRMDGEKDAAVQAAREAVVGASWYRVWYHVCRNDEHLPCEKWELIESKET